MTEVQYWTNFGSGFGQDLVHYLVYSDLKSTVVEEFVSVELIF